MSSDGNTMRAMPTRGAEHRHANSDAIMPAVALHHHAGTNLNPERASADLNPKRAPQHDARNGTADERAAGADDEPEGGSSRGREETTVTQQLPQRLHSSYSFRGRGETSVDTGGDSGGRLDGFGPRGGGGGAVEVKGGEDGAVAGAVAVKGDGGVVGVGGARGGVGGYSGEGRGDGGSRRAGCGVEYIQVPNGTGVCGVGRVCGTQVRGTGHTHNTGYTHNGTEVSGAGECSTEVPKGTEVCGVGEVFGLPRVGVGVRWMVRNHKMLVAGFDDHFSCTPLDPTGHSPEP